MTRLAFRLYGSFRWPPLPPGPATDARNITGRIDIFHIAAGGRRVACVGWVPQTALPEPTSDWPFDVDEIKYLPNLRDPELHRLVGDGAEPFALRLDAESATTAVWGRRLQFSGATLFDQYAPDEKGEMRRHLRWLLAPSFRQGAGSYSSELIVGRPQDTVASGAHFLFSFALPTPGPQAVIDGAVSHVVAFQAGYRPFLDDHAIKTPVALFEFGAGPRGRLPADKLEQVEKLSLSEKHLGGFGLCASDGGRNYFFFPREWSLRRAEYWLEDRQRFVEGILRRLGRIAPRLKSAILFARQANPPPGDSSEGDEGERWNSIGFIIEPRRPQRTTINFRSAIFSDGTTEVSDGDIGLYSPAPQSGTLFMLRDPADRSRWMRTEASHLVLDLEVAYEIDNALLWEVVEKPWTLSMELRIRLGFIGEVGGQPGSGDLDEGGPSGDKITPNHLLSAAIKGMRLARIDLQNIEAAQPQSILPDVVRIDSPGGSPRFAYCTSVRARPSETGDAIEWESGRPAGGASWHGAPLRLTLWPADDWRRIDTTVPVSLVATLRLPSFAYPDTRDSPRFKVKLSHDREASDRGAAYAFGFRLRAESGAAVSARLGGFEFRTQASVLELPTGDDEGDADYSHWRFGPRARIDSHWAANTEFRLRIAAESVRPLAVDHPRHDRSAGVRPLLISLNTKTSPGSRYLLDVTERVSGDGDRHLVASIVDRSRGAAHAGSYVVLSERPFSIVKFHSRPLAERGGAENAQVAFYDSDTRGWQLKLVSPAYHYEFPPQSIGESMDKPRRLEIHDPEGPSADAIVPPYLVDEQGVERRHAIEFRLTPSAELWVRPSDVELGYFLPEWATHEMFRQRGALGTGAALVAFRGEFLYGLTVGIDVAAEGGPARGARVAEIEALLGRPPGPIRGSAADEDLEARWDRLSATIARRPERLEFWMREPSSPMPFTPARFVSGVRFALRDSAVHALPVQPDERLNNDYLASRPVRIRRHGLRGGAIWPLESRNVCRALLDSPDANGGTIERIALSPTGGDADQRAEFLNGVLAIISETRNGHVQRHRVEIIGRITQYWHRAKHVVVYERTVNPSAQFTPEPTTNPDGSVGPGIGTRTRRPVLRKVSEYVELLQPERAYPDFAVATPETSAGLRKVRFNSRIINVDSAWSEEVGDFGWKIPLWNRRSAKIRPTIYPRPDVAFVTAAEGEGDGAVVAQDTPEPDLLHFFVDLRAGTSETDAWFSRAGLDCANFCPPKHEHQHEFEELGEERRQPGAPRIPRGHRRFTLRLNPAARRSVLNADRGEAPIFGGLESITFMRSNALDPAKPSAEATALEKALAGARTGLKETSDTTMAGIAGAWAGFRRAAADGDAAQLDTAARELVKALETPTKSDWSYAEKLKDLPAVVKGAGSPCDRLVDDFTGSLQRKKLMILDQIRTWQDHAVDHFPTVADWQTLQIDSKEKLIDEVSSGVMRLIAPSLEHVQADIGKVENGVEQAREIVRDFEREVEAALTRARRKLDEVVASYDFEKPWSPHRVEEFHRRLASVRDGVVADVASVAVEIQSRLATELGALSHRIGTTVGHYLRELTTGKSDLLRALGGAENAAAAYLRTADGQLTKFDGHLEALPARLDAAIAKAPQHAGPLNALKAKLIAVRETLSLQRAALADAADKVGTAGGTLEKTVSTVAATVATLLTEAKAFANEAVDDIGAIADAELGELKGQLIDGANAVHAVADAYIGLLPKIGERPDWLVARARAQLADALTAIQRTEQDAFATIARVADEIQERLKELKAAVDEAKVAAMLRDQVVRPAVDEAFEAIVFADYQPITEARLEQLRGYLREIDETVAERLDDLDRYASQFIEGVRAQARQACTDLQAGLDAAHKWLDDRAQELLDQLGPMAQQLRNAIGQAEQLRKLAEDLADDVKKIGDELSESYSAAQAYADRVFDSAANLTSGGLAAAPGNILRCWAAVSSAPELPGLELARDRIACYYNALNKYVDTTPVEAWFGRLGDELKAMGLSFPFDKIGMGLIPNDLSKFDIGRVFKNFGGIDLSKLFGGYKLPAGASDAIKLTHNFDKKQFRAWVQIDINLPLPGRKALFTTGPFKLDFVDGRLVGVLRLEASKDNPEVEQTGRASFHTDIDAVVSGQSMVTLQKVVLNYDRRSGLKVDFDPKNIRLNPAFRFIQETLAGLFPDELGGLKVVKKDGIPIGVEHEFSMPPISLMAGTSGVSNIQISNQFALIAYPEFVISNRFALSKPELPFLFSIFIIGGTGYINVDCEYRPFSSQLAVMVEAAAGGSAALGFAIGPVSGSVFVSLSIALSYRKVIGRSGGGLTASLVLLIAGTVDVAGIASVYMGLLLRMSYRDNGDIDGVGTLTITVRISRWFKISVRRNVTYQLRKGKAQSRSSTQLTMSDEDPYLTKARKLLEARG